MPAAGFVMFLQRASTKNHSPSVRCSPSMRAPMRARSVLLFLISFSLTLPLRAQEDIEVPAGFLVDTVCDEIDAAVSMALARDGRVFVCEQMGAVRVVKNGALLAEPFVRLRLNQR